MTLHTSTAPPPRAPLGELKIALVHEWLSAKAGSEQTFLEMARCLPNADLFALSHNKERSFDYDGRHITTSRLQRWTTDGGKAAALPFMPAAMAALGRGREYDLVVTSSHAFSRAFVSWGTTKVHLSYTYTPARYLWLPEIESHRARFAIPAAARVPLRTLDRRIAQNVDGFAGIATGIKDRISECYDADARVIYPPCDTEYFHEAADQPARKGAIVVSRLIPYKRADLAIKTCGALGLPLQIIGEGPYEAELRRVAKGSAPGLVEFRGGVSRAELRAAYQRAEVVLFPANEDFGIVPVEAQACGARVVALDEGGSQETVLRVDGAHAPSISVEDFTNSVKSVLEQPAGAQWRAHAENFSTERFRTEFTAWVVDAMAAS